MRGIPGAPFCNCATFSASDMQRIKSYARSFSECDGSFQIGGSLTTGMRGASPENWSANSDAANETTDAPAAFFTSNVLNLALPAFAEKEIFSAPLIESSSCSIEAVM